MVRKIIIPQTNIEISRFIFGTASLFNVGSSKQRVKLLHAAVENGFTHFDTAPYYGFGITERDLSFILEEHPSISVTTKVGIYSPGGEAQSSTNVFFRKVLGRFVKSVSKPEIDFTLSRAKKSLEGSLRRLRRGHVELYMLHDPEITIINTEEWQRWLEDRVTLGQIRHFGVASTADNLLPFFERGTKLTDVTQLFDSIEHKEADVLQKYGKSLQITYGYVSAARAAGSCKSVKEILTDALNRNQNGAIIVSTKQIGRVSQYSRILEGVK